MEIIKVIGMFMLGIGGIVIGIIEIRNNTNKPLQVSLSLLVVILGIIGYALFSQLLYLIIGFIGLLLMLVLE